MFDKNQIIVSWIYFWKKKLLKEKKYVFLYNV